MCDLPRKARIVAERLRELGVYEAILKAGPFPGAHWGCAFWAPAERNAAKKRIESKRFR